MAGRTHQGGVKEACLTLKQISDIGIGGLPGLVNNREGVNNFVVLTIEDGLGMGIVIDGELSRGSNGFAGER